MIYKSRFPEIEAELLLKTDLVAKAVAEQVERGAKERVPVASGRLQAAIHTERTDHGEYSVIAGDNRAFYGHVIEHGGAHTGPRPFLVPSLEEARNDVPKIGKEALRSL